MKGSVYQKLGFTFSHISKPNYNWVKETQILSRYSTQKSNLVKQGYQGNTENEIMISRGFHKIFDSGNEVYIKEYL